MNGRLYSNHVQGTGYTVIKMDAESKQSEAFDTYLYVAFKE